MKKLFAIFLLSIHLYNLGGYMVLFQYLIHQSNQFNEEQISKNRYKVSDLVEVKIPVKLPNLTNWNTYQRVSGAIQLRANWYNYVKLRITRDTLFVMCIPNYRTTRLTNANIIYARDISEAPLNAKKQTFPIKSISLFKYISLTIMAVVIPPVRLSKPVPVYFNPSPIMLHCDVPGQPPELIS